MLHSGASRDNKKRSREKNDDMQLVISLDIGDYTVKRKLVDTRSAENLLF